MRDLLLAKQGGNATANTNRYNTLAQDEQTRLDQLGKYTATEGGLAQLNQANQADQNKFNLTQILQDMQGKNAYDLNSYLEELKKWGAEQQAKGYDQPQEAERNKAATLLDPGGFFKSIW